MSSLFSYGGKEESPAARPGFKFREQSAAAEWDAQQL
jgi:hypothetical protein